MIRAEITRSEESSQKPLGEQERLEIIARERALKASPRWRADVLSRKLAIIRGQPTRVTLDGKTSERTLPFDVENDLGISYKPFQPRKQYLDE